jgi:hypothetical protein
VSVPVRRRRQKKTESNTHQPHNPAQRQNLHVLPPHRLPHASGPPPKRRSLTGHRVCPVYQQLDPLSTAQDLLYVLDHDILDLVEFRLCPGHLIRRWRGVVLVHEGGDRGGKRALQAIGGIVRGREGARFCELGE